MDCCHCTCIRHKYDNFFSSVPDIDFVLKVWIYLTLNYTVYISIQVREDNFKHGSVLFCGFSSFSAALNNFIR